MLTDVGDVLLLSSFNIISVCFFIFALPHDGENKVIYYAMISAGSIVAMGPIAWQSQSNGLISSFILCCQTQLCVKFIKVYSTTHIGLARIKCNSNSAYM